MPELPRSRPSAATSKRWSWDAASSASPSTRAASEWRSRTHRASWRRSCAAEPRAPRPSRQVPAHAPRRRPHVGGAPAHDGPAAAAPHGEASGRFERARIDFDDGTGLRFEDSRKFGTWHLVEDPREAFPRAGPDALSDAFTPAWLRGALARRSVPIKTALLDQRVAAGVGNIYADEALWLAGIDPHAAATASGRGACDGCTARCDRRCSTASTIAAPRSTATATRSGSGGHHLRCTCSDATASRASGLDAGGRRISKTRIGGRATHYCGSCQRP